MHQPFPPRSWWAIVALAVLPAALCGNDDRIATPWKPLPDPQADHAAHAAVAVGNRIYLVGGDSGSPLEIFDPENGKWLGKTPQPSEHLFPGAAVLGQRIYVVGGQARDSKYCRAVDVFDTERGKWLPGTPMTVGRNRLAAVALRGKIYAIGGVLDDGSDGCSRVVEEYDPQQDRWVRRADVPTGRHGHCALAWDGKIIVLGGYDSKGQTSSVEVYDPAADRWSPSTDMPIARVFFGAVALGDQVYVLGGYGLDNPPMHACDLRGRKWRTIDASPGSCWRFGCTSWNGAVYIFGGERTERAARVHRPVAK